MNLKPILCLSMSLALVALSACAIRNQNAYESAPFPEGILLGQIIREVSVDGAEYALVARPSSSMPLVGEIPPGFRGSFGGILKKSEGRWIPFAQIQDRDSTEPNNVNNPLNFWTEDGKLNLAIYDGNGGGSGEGIAKLFQSSDQGKHWVQGACWSYSATDEWKPYSVAQVEQMMAKGPSGESYSLNAEGNFTLTQFNKGNGKMLTQPAPDCSNATVVSAK